MGKINDARAELGAHKARIASLRKRRDALAAELAEVEALGGLTRVEEIKNAIEALDDALPIANLPSDAWRPEIQFELESAARVLDDLRRERENLAKDIDALESERERWEPHLPEALAAIQTLESVFASLDFPSGLQRARVHLTNLELRFGMLPAWRERLAKYDDDDELVYWRRDDE